MRRNRIVGTIAAIVGAVGVLAWPSAVDALQPRGLFGPLVVLAVLGVLGVAAHLLWPDLSLAMQVAVCAISTLIGGGIAWIAIIVAGFAAETHPICAEDGSDGGSTLGLVGGLVVYAAIVAFGFQRPKRLPFLWPLAGIAGAAVSYGLTVAFPSAHGICTD